MTTEGNTESSQAEMQTKAATLIVSQASTAPNASSVSSSSTSSAQASSGEGSSNSLETASSTSSGSETNASTSKAPSVPLDSSKANVTMASSLSTSGIVTNATLTNGSIASQANGQDPAISTIEATGSVANDITGPATLDGINITIKANNLVPNNFLTPDGLHWSANTQVIPITGQVTGQISTENFGQTDGPTIPATTYTMNAGDSGRITNVGRTLAGTNLDLIYKVISTDESSWQAPQKVRLTVRLDWLLQASKTLLTPTEIRLSPSTTGQIMSTSIIKSSPITRIFKSLFSPHLSQRILIWPKESRPILPTF
ncbi:hypothetical protein OBG91_14520 [Lactococcus lactis]|nr:hypothetical protein [Lactococcus lactis]